jgi:hypothetical protein
MLLKQTFAAPLLDASVVVSAPEPSGPRPKVVGACCAQANESTTVVASAARTCTESPLSSSKPNCAWSMTSSPPAASDVPAAIEYGVWVESLSTSFRPDRSATFVPVLMSSIQSAGAPPFDSISLILTLGGAAITTCAGWPMVPGEPTSFVLLAAAAPVVPNTLRSEIVPLSPA